MAKKKQSRSMPRPVNSTGIKAGKPGQLRIIGGQWRSRRLPVASVSGLRPTPDRVRETLFNWLQMDVAGARCLDLFAGSGALGFEALSREAVEVVMVEKHPAAYAQLQANATTLRAEGLTLLNTDGLVFLGTGPEPFDVIFLDPPFRQGFIDQVLEQIIQQKLLKPGGKLYLEYEEELAPDLVAMGLQLLRETRAGQVISVLSTYV
ncbi:MAG: 16S rRNA (guanine(966)-N(2))-methyltransferase RsmD [Thiolinea sp.]